MRSASLSTAIAIALSILHPAAHAAQRTDEPIPYMDAHSHLLLPSVTPDEEIALFQKAGVAAVVIMHSDPEVLQAVAKQYPGYVIPFISIARTPDMPGLRLSDDTAATFAKLHDAGAVCGFGEMPTRLEPRADASDAAALLNPMRLKIYDLANARGVPVNFHVSLETPAVIEAFGRIAQSYPRMPLILAHAGWMAGPEIVATLLAAHPNIYVDLSVRLDPSLGFGLGTGLGVGMAPAPRPNGPNQLSILGADGALQPAWRALLERFPERFLFAMDVTNTGAAGRQQYISELLANARTAFGALPRETHAAIAYGNMEKLLRGCGISNPHKINPP